MYVRRNIRLGLIMRFAWRNLVGFIVWSSLVTWLYMYLRNHYGLDVRLPFLPIGTIGTAVAIYLAFKNSQSYDRFWEGRKIWGSIVNLSRSWGAQVRSYVTDTGATQSVTSDELLLVHRELIYRQLAWLNALRLQLRRTTIHDRHNISFMPHLDLNPDRGNEPKVGQFISAAECQQVSAAANPATQLLLNQSRAVQRLCDQGLLDTFRQVDLMQTIKDCYNQQGMCERIKNTPFPRQYAFFSTVFTWIFVVLLPFGLVSEFSKLSLGSGVWLTVPFSVLVSWIFTTIEIVGDNSEDPFENYVNDVPMTAICRTIEIDLREMLGETELPPRMQPVNDILL